MNIFFYNKTLAIINSHYLTTDVLVEKISTWSNIPDFHKDVLIKFHSLYRTICENENASIEFTVPTEDSNYTLSYESISEIISDCVYKLCYRSGGNMEVDLSLHDWNDLYAVSIAYPLETLLFLFPMFIHLCGIEKFALLYPLLQQDPKILSTFLFKVFGIADHLSYSDNDPSIFPEDPSWIEEDPNKLINWGHFYPDNPYEAYSESTLRDLIEGDIVIDFSTRVPELTIPNEVSITHSVLESTSSPSEGINDPEIGESNSLVVRNNLTRR